MNAAIQPMSPRMLAARMVVYAVSFLAFVLVLLPVAFHAAGVAVGLQPMGERFFGILGPARPYAGAVILAFGVIAYFICSLWLVIVGKGPFVEFDPPREFVSSGPYRWMRNPVAAALLIAGLGEAILFASFGIAMLILLGLPIAHLQVTCIEEPRLRQRFGESYETYLQTVNRWLPRKPELKKVISDQ